jgi:hypothetical protein
MSGCNTLNRVETGLPTVSDNPEVQISSHSRTPRNSKKAKDQPTSPETLTYYPPIWKDFLEEAK